MYKVTNTDRAVIGKFNRELDRVVRGGPISGDDLPPDEVRALRLAQKLSASDFSSHSAIQETLRGQLSERSTHRHGRITIFSHVFMLNEGRTLAGIGMTALLVFLMVFGLLSPQHVTATPAINTMAAMSIQPEPPAVSLTVAAAHNQHFYPKPVPTPGFMPMSAGQSTTSPECTRVLADPSSGNQYPIVTTTILK